MIVVNLVTLTAALFNLLGFTWVTSLHQAVKACQKQKLQFFMNISKSQTQKFYNFGPSYQCYKTFFVANEAPLRQAGVIVLVSFSSPILVFTGKARSLPCVATLHKNSLHTRLERLLTSLSSQYVMPMYPVKSNICNKSTTYKDAAYNINKFNITYVLIIYCYE